MERAKINRINELARKQREGTLTEAEKAEQKQLRDEFRRDIVGDLNSQLDCIYIKQPDGTEKKLTGDKK
ncbi:MAG: DUF896 domain-containing protein [Oscillospiraceae bacterium]